MGSSKAREELTSLYDRANHVEVKGNMELFASLVAGALLVEARGADGVLRLDWTGRSNGQRPGLMLAPYFEAVLMRARAEGSCIEVHFERLEFFNSSTVASVIGFIRAAREQGTMLAIVFDGELKWQALSFTALKSLELPDGLLKIRPSRALPSTPLGVNGNCAM